MTSRAEREIEDLQEELGQVQRDRDEALLLAENDRQQVCSLLLLASNYLVVLLREIYGFSNPGLYKL